MTYLQFMTDICGLVTSTVKLTDELGMCKSDLCRGVFEDHLCIVCECMLDVCPPVHDSHKLECAFRARAGCCIARRLEEGTAQTVSQSLKMHHS